MKTLKIITFKEATTLSLEKLDFTKSFLFVKTSDTIYRIAKDSIVYCQAQGNYTYIHTLKGKICSSKTLKYYNTILEEKLFIRPHQSYLVNMKFIDRLFYDARNYIEMESGEKIPISRNRKANVISLFRNL